MSSDIPLKLQYALIEGEPSEDFNTNWNVLSLPGTGIDSSKFTPNNPYPL